MAHDDMDVVMYKVLAYCYACMRAGKDADVFEARSLARCNEAYFSAVVEELLEMGLLRGSAFRDMNGSLLGASVSISYAGVEFLAENGRMGKARDFLGKAFAYALEAAVKAAAQ